MFQDIHIQAEVLAVYCFFLTVDALINVELEYKTCQIRNVHLIFPSSRLLFLRNVLLANETLNANYVN